MLSDPLLTVDQVAEALGLKPGTIYKWVQTRRIPFVKLGGAVRFRKSTIEAFIAEREKPAITEDSAREKLIELGLLDACAS